MRKQNWQLLFVLVLLAASIVFYLVHYIIFRDAHHIFIYLIGDIAFVFVQVLLVTLFIQKVLEEREKEALLKKLNMVIGAFFSEVGTGLLNRISRYDCDVDRITCEFTASSNWLKKDFGKVKERIKTHPYCTSWPRNDLPDLKNFLVNKRDFLLRLLENPNLLEHESFTELLWSVFHLTEELAARNDVMQIPETDLTHLNGDIGRVYSALTIQWLNYMQHLSTDYPFLFSFAIRTNPFNPQASAEVTQ